MRWKVWLRVEAGFRMGDMIKGRGRSGVASGLRVSLGYVWIWVCVRGGVR